MQARAKDRGGIQIRDQHILLEAPGARDQFTLSIENHATTIENNFILSANQIEVDDDHAIIDCPRSHHIFAELILRGMKRRAIDVDNHLRARVRLHSHWPGRIPDVLADIHAHVYAVDQEQRGLVPSLEEAIIVEDAVIGQIMLVIGAHQLALVDKRGGVVNVMHAIDKADH